MNENEARELLAALTDQELLVAKNLLGYVTSPVDLLKQVERCKTVTAQDRNKDDVTRKLYSFFRDITAAQAQAIALLANTDFKEIK